LAHSAIGFVKREIEAGVELLARIAHALAVALSDFCFGQQLIRHRLAGRADLAHQCKNTRVVDPLFEHLRRRFDKIAQRAGAGLR
jgi:hypothetical protein